MNQDIALDFYCGLGGWTDGLLAEGFHCIGFDVERHDYGTGGYPGQLILQDVLTVTGAQFRSIADRIRILVASPPCTEYSYMAMPWKRAKQIRRALLGEGDFPAGYKGSRTLEQLNALFAACFRIQRELSAVAGRHIPLIVENVKGAQPWVGMAKANFGSYYLWGDVGRVGKRVVPLNGALHDAGVRPRSRPKAGGSWTEGRPSHTTDHAWKTNPDGTEHPLGSWFAVADSKTRGAKSNGQNWSLYAQTGEVSLHWRLAAAKNEGGSWFNIAHNKESGVGQNPDGRKTDKYLNVRDGEPHTRHLTNPQEHVKGFNGAASGQGNLGKNQLGRMAWSNSEKRKQASAMIAKIPFPLAQHVARCFSTRLHSASTDGVLTVSPFGG